MPASTPRSNLTLLPPARRQRRDNLDRLERHMQGLRVHLEAIGLRAEASAVTTQLTLLRAAR